MADQKPIYKLFLNLIFVRIHDGGDWKVNQIGNFVLKIFFHWALLLNQFINCQFYRLEIEINRIFREGYHPDFVCYMVINCANKSLLSCGYIWRYLFLTMNAFFLCLFSEEGEIIFTDVVITFSIAKTILEATKGLPS